MSSTDNGSSQKKTQDEIWEERFLELRRQNPQGVAHRSGYMVYVSFNPFIRVNREIDLRTNEEKEADSQQDVPF